MAVNYASLQKTAFNLLKANGQAITFSYTSGEDIDPATGVVSDAGTSVNVTGYGAATKYKNMEIDGEAKGWNVYVNSGNWRVMDVEEISPAGTNVIYICQLRK